MIRFPRVSRPFLAIIALPALAALAGCHSYHIETTVENRTGGPIQLLEVDYPNASFGDNALAANATFHYRIQLQGSGPLKVQFTASDGKLQQITGPTVSEGQEGRLEIVLLPSGKAEFNPQLTAKP
ncbi:MAG: hypothetical protein ABR976_01235 [Terracidiphilus sp.]|jgi:hypothetical protein